MRDTRSGASRRAHRGGAKLSSVGADVSRQYQVADIDPRCITLVDPMTYEGVQYFRLKWTLSHMRRGDAAVVVCVCSAAASDGKTLTAINLAGALAQDTDAKVLLLDADLRRRSETIGHFLSLADSEGMGLGDLLHRPRLRLDEVVVRRRGLRNFDLLLVGTVAVPPYEALASRRFGDVMAQARESYTYVIIDAPPVVAVPDCKTLSDSADGMLMVVAANRTPRPVVAEALRNLQEEKLIGLVLNECDQLPRRYHSYYGGYGYAPRATRTNGLNRPAVSGTTSATEPARDEDRQAGGSAL